MKGDLGVNQSDFIFAKKKILFLLHLKIRLILLFYLDTILAYLKQTYLSNA